MQITMPFIWHYIRQSEPLNLTHIDGLVDHTHQVVPYVLACVLDSNVNNLCLFEDVSRGQSHYNANFLWMLLNYKGMLVHKTSVSMYVQRNS